MVSKNTSKIQVAESKFSDRHLHKMSVQGAINAPRFATMSFPQTSTPHQYDKDLLLLEGRIPDAVGNRLTNAGHIVKKWRDFDWRAGAVCAIKRDEKTGRLEGGADPRRPSGVA